MAELTPEGNNAWLYKAYCSLMQLFLMAEPIQKEHAHMTRCAWLWRSQLQTLHPCPLHLITELLNLQLEVQCRNNGTRGR